jgi:cytochrome d ubiquinol oxidase subunit II
MVMFWVAVLIIGTLLYVLLDGFDLGIGILFGLTRDETRRHAMLSAVSPIWDGNETWLVVAGVVLWGAFPVVYATLFSAFYLPLLLMLAGLILRGVAFEYRYKSERMRWVWDAGFASGSLCAAFIQGLMVGLWSKACRFQTTITPAVSSGGSVHSPCCAGSGFPLATPCSAPAGSSRSVKAKSGIVPIGRSRIWQWGSSPF